MHQISNELFFFIVLSVLLFLVGAILMMIVMDSKAKLPGGFVSDPFSIAGIRRDHPVISFVTTVCLAAIIFGLLFNLAAVVAGRFRLFQPAEKPELLAQLHEERFTERQRHFHNEPSQNQVDLGKKQACFYCHGDYPHSKKQMVRTLMNMHTQFIGCMTCHTDEEKIPESEYSFRWLNYSGIDVKGPPYGTSINPDTGYLVVTDDYYSKIVVDVEQDGKSQLLELSEDKPEVQEFAALISGGQLSDEDREGLKRRFHALIRNKGRTCSRCHTEESKSYLPLRALGFSDQRIYDLTNLEIIGIVEKYKDFYLPDLMKNEGGSGAEQPDEASGEQAPSDPAEGA